MINQTNTANPNRLGYVGSKPGVKAKRIWNTPLHILSVADDVVGLENFYSTYLMGQKEALEAALANPNPSLILTVNNTDARIHGQILAKSTTTFLLTGRLAFLDENMVPIKGNTRGSILYIIKGTWRHHRALGKALDAVGQDGMLCAVSEKSRLLVEKYHEKA